MRLLITGMSGTLAPKLAAAARRAGHEPVGWDHRALSPTDAAGSAAWLRAQQPQAIAHLALGPVPWAAMLAAYAATHGLPFVLTSSAMVFHHVPDGPHHAGDARTAQDDYGRYKIACEDAVRAAYSGACVARLGWQIDADAKGNNMLAQLDQRQAGDGRIGASRHWRPACSFMEDTARALLALVETRAAGVVHLDSNAHEGHRFDAIVRALAARFERPHWQVQADDDYAHDQRLVGDEARMPPLAARLPALRG
jgi:dTDP-4-dehydrorhamnose reductase